MRGLFLLLWIPGLWACAASPTEVQTRAETPAEEPETEASAEVPDAGAGEFDAAPEQAPDAGNSSTEESEATHEELGEHATEIEDELGDEDPDPSEGAQDLHHPLADQTDDELRQMLRKGLSSFGSISLGMTNGGALLNPVQMPENERWVVRVPRLAWGTQETVDALVRSIDMVHEQHPETPKIYIGHLSMKNGGRFPPHRSHQSGRDVDIGYYYTGGEPWYTRANEKNLDKARTWSLVRAFITETDVQLIFIDISLQRVLKEYALGIGEDPHWIDQIFGGKTATLRPIIRHARGHATHIHVRFYNPVAQETGRRLYPILVRSKAIHPPTYYVHHRARKGQTLSQLARRYGTTTRAIRRANRLRSTMIREGRVYKIPRTGGVHPHDRGPVAIPPRRLPPDKTIAVSR